MLTHAMTRPLPRKWLADYRPPQEAREPVGFNQRIRMVALARDEARQERERLRTERRRASQ